MSESTLIHYQESSRSILSKPDTNYQVEPFQIKTKSLTHHKIQQMINHWDPFAKIQQKFSIWALSFTFDKVLKIAPQQFYKAAIHYVFMKKLQSLIKGFDKNEVIKRSSQLKDMYQILSLKGKLKGKKFDYLLIVTVKLIGFFLGYHTRDIIINDELQSQIYTILIYVLLGTQVGERAYHLILEKYKKKATLKFNRNSQIQKYLIHPILQGKKLSEHHHKTAKTTVCSKKRIGRTQCRTGTQLFKQPKKMLQDPSYRQMKQMIKFNLQVRQFIPKQKVKQSLDTVLNKAVDIETKMDELSVAKSMQKSDMKHKKVFYTQMSASLDLLKNNHSLSVLQNHSINIKPEKQAKFFKLKTKDQIIKSSKSAQNLNEKLPKIQKLPYVQQTYSYQSNMIKKKQPTYWKKVITQMKENHYENIEHFPPIGAKMYFKAGELDDDVRRQSFSESVVLKEQDTNQQDDYNAEYLTQKPVQLISNTVKQINLNEQLGKTFKKIISDSLTKKTPINTKKVIQEQKKVIEEQKNQINIVQYSKVANDSEIYKTEKGFLNVYSNKPIEDQKKKLKKKSYFELKDLQKKFLEDCKIRELKIQQSYFS